jgi:hypothetical protein
MFKKLQKYMQEDGLALQAQYSGADAHTKHATALGNSAEDIIFPN